MSQAPAWATADLARPPTATDAAYGVSAAHARLLMIGAATLSPRAELRLLAAPVLALEEVIKASASQQKARMARLSDSPLEKQRG